MSIRESIAKQRGVATAIALGAVLIATFVIARNLFSSPPTISNAGYFTIDDGKTQFIESSDHFPPFDHDGKPAYRARMYTCDNGKTTFIAYLERYTPAAKRRLEAQLADFNAGKSHAPPSSGPADKEVKKPGETNRWINCSDFAQAGKIMEVQCPEGGIPEAASP